MDMGSPSNTTMEVMMVPWLHFTGGDSLFFNAIHPSSPGAIAGASFVVFAIAVFERWVATQRSVMEAKWRHSALAVVSDSSKHEIVADTCCDSEGVDSTSSDAHDTPNTAEKSPTATRARHPRTFAPFNVWHDFARGCLFAAQALLGYTLMLGVMTFQAAYIISIIAGVAVGEMCFGRKRSHDHSMH